MSSVCVQSFKDLVRIPCILPFGNRTDYVEAEGSCKLWIETAASTAIAAGFFFTNILALKVTQYVIDCIVHAIMGPYANTYFSKILANNVMFMLISMIFSRFDSHADVLSSLAGNIYFGFNNYRSGNYHFLAVNILYAAKKLRPPENYSPVYHTGKWRRPIHDFANNWAPTMARLYGYSKI